MNPESAVTTRILSASEYVFALHEPTDRVAVVLRNRHLDHTLQRIMPAETIASPEFQHWLMQQNRAGSDIFIGMNPLKDGAISRSKENIREIRHVYLDIDEDGQATLANLRDSLDAPPPNFVLDTSPEKYQVVWKIEGLDIEEAESLLHSLASEFGGDNAATDATRVLRLPGFVNRKYASGPEFVVQAHYESNRVYSLRDFNVQEGSPDSPRYVTDADSGRRRMPPGHKSQSEHDWAYAKRALARGDEPEIVIQRIADFRREDKSDPEFYARLTVTKAKAALETQAATRQSEIRSNRELTSERQPQH